MIWKGLEHMRDFFIKSLEMLVNVGVVIAALSIVVSAGVVAFSGDGFEGLGPVVSGLIVLVLGFLYLVLTAGFVYLGLGIYQNTKATTEAIERLGSR